MKSIYSVLGLFAMALALGGCDTVATNKQPVGITAPAKKILRKWIEYSGGADALRANGDYLSVATIDYGDGSSKLQSTMWRTADGKFRNELILPNGVKVIGAFDSKNAWFFSEPLGFGAMTSVDAQQTLMRGDIMESLNVGKNYLYCRVSANKVIGGKTYPVLELQGNNGLYEWWVFDPETGRRVRCEYQTGPGANATSVSEFEDFRRVGALTVPYINRSTANGRLSVVTVESVVLNPSMLGVEFSPTPEQLWDAEMITQMLNRYVEGIGGIDAFAQLKSRVMDTSVVVGNARNRTVLSQKMPNKILLETEIQGAGKMQQGYDGRTGWVNSELQGYRVMKGIELQQLLNSADLHTEAKLPERCPLRKRIGERMVNDRRTEAIALASWQGPAGIYYFDVETARLIRIETTLIAGAKSALPVTIDFADFRTTDGITMPFKITTVNPAMQMVTTINSVENNVPLDDEIFKPREN